MNAGLTLAYEQKYFAGGMRAIAGVDEVGRGSLAGPVVAAVVVVEPVTERVIGVKDSKLLSARQRERLAEGLRLKVKQWSIGVVSPRGIDKIGIFQATLLAMYRALIKIETVDGVIVDGLHLPKIPRKIKASAWTMVRGDQRVYAIAAASIIAKVYRDQLMLKLHAKYPTYGWNSNMGYGTKQHIDEIRRIGTSHYHRISFIDHLIN